jgi:IMP dehydrogenase
MLEALTYDDVLLLPQYSDIRSRSEVDISTDLGNGLELSLPILASPMDTISGVGMAVGMSNAGGSAIIHRYNTMAKQAELIKLAKANGAEQVGFAVGVGDDLLHRADACLSAGGDFICVDVAHGHHIMMKEALTLLRREFPPDIHIMAGNVATIAGVNDLADWGANSVRCNIGGGSICSTRVQTGHGAPGLHTISDCARTDRNVAIIADGGIRNSGDIVKAFAAGADAVILGSLLAGTRETPGEVFTNAQERYLISLPILTRGYALGYRILGLVLCENCAPELPGFVKLLLEQARAELIFLRGIGNVQQRAKLRRRYKNNSIPRV